jgi:prophage antirepressor-like protein
VSDIIKFQFEKHDVQVITDERGEPWFIAMEVAAALEYSDAEAMTRRLDDDEKQNRQVVGFGPRGVTVINESGLYSAILGSAKPEAKAFKRWVTREVLPSIRKTGAYVPPQQLVRRTSPVQLQPVRDLLLVGRAMSKVKGVNEALAMAYTLDAIEKSTGLPATMLTKALPAVAPDDAVTLNATQVGEPLSMSGRATNLLLEKLGFQYRDENNRWKLTEAGTAYGEMKPFHRNGHSDYAILWRPSVADVIRNHLNESEKSA